MKVMISGLLSTVLALLTGCATLNSVSQTQIPDDRRNEVKAESSRLIILGLNFDNDFVDAVSRDLESQCEGGEVRGILTKDEMIGYFLFVHRRRVSASGYCLKDELKGA